MGLFDKFLAVFGKSSAPAAPAAPVAVPPTSAEVIVAVSNRVDRRVRPRRNPSPGTRVLLIDDSPAILAALRKTLVSAGCATVEAADAESGLEHARTQRPDLIFLDIVLPGMNGFAALRQLRRDPATRDIPVIMISGNEQAAEQFFGSRIGADDFMKKPFARHEIFARIERLLDAEGVPRRRVEAVPPLQVVAPVTAAARA